MSSVTPSPDAQLFRRERVAGIDAVRYIAFLSIVVLHCLPKENVPFSVTFLNHATRYAVPFFFITSGYFLGLKDQAPVKGIIRLFVRLAPVFVFWALFYVVLYKEAGVFTLNNLPHFLLTGQPGFHLWFLPSLGMAAALLLVLKRFGMPVLWAAALFLYALALGFGPYRDVAGLPYTSFDTRNGPFFSFPFVFMGYFLAQRNISASMPAAFLIAAGGLAIQVEEAFLIAAIEGTPVAPYNFTLGTLAFGLGVFLMAQNLKNGPITAAFARLGVISLGMYCVHVLFLYLGRHAFAQNDFADYSALIAIVAAGATVSGVVMAKIPYVRRLVR